MFRIDQYDSTIRQLAEYIVGTSADDVSASTRDALVRHHLDSFGCALGSYSSPVCQAVLSIARSARADQGASVMGLPDRTTPEYATFANSALIRFLDYNDNYLRNGGGHTSDLIPAVLAAAEQHHRNGIDFIVGLHVGYEVFAAFADAIRNRDRGWDYPFFIGIAAAAGTAKLLDLPVEQVASAISMSITPNLPFGITRVGPLANWKGLAAPYAAMNGYFAARLASLGITGPPEAIEGHRGMQHLASGPFDLSQLGVPQHELSAGERSSYKLHVAEFNAQGPVGVFVGLHREGVTADDIASISIGTYEVAWSEIGGGQDDHDIKWDPMNKETADHSLPYMIAVALVDGAVTAESYALDRVRDPALRPLMNKINVSVDDEITANWDQEPAHQIEIRFADGRERSFRSVFPKGHPANPATNQEIVDKFRSQAEPALGSEATDELLDELWAIADSPDMAAFGDRLRGLDLADAGRITTRPR